MMSNGKVLKLEISFVDTIGAAAPFELGLSSVIKLKRSWQDGSLPRLTVRLLGCGVTLRYTREEIG